MSQSAAAKAGDAILTPRSTGERVPFTIDVTTTEAEAQLWTWLGAADKGKFYATFKAIDGDVRFWFKTGSSTVTIGDDSDNGYLVKDGTIEPFWIDSLVDTYIEVIGSTTCKLQVTITSWVSEKPGGVL